MKQGMTWRAVRMTALLLLGTVLALSGSHSAWATNLPGGGIVNSPHDFSAVGWNTTNQICKVCHIPHGANTATTSAPLWNRNITTATFNLYNSATLNATMGQPDGVSKLCLSCHDGTIGLESFGSTSGNLDSWSRTATTGNLINATFKLGTNLSNDHPISFTYDSALVTADGGLNDPTALTGVKLYVSKVECASCHDVHNKGATGPGADPLLRVNNDASALCLKCHAK